MHNCNQCCFAQVENGKQIACLANKYEYVKIQDLEAKASNDDGFFELERLCLYKRKADWEEGEDLDYKLKKAYSQLFPNIGFCIDDDSEDPNDLENLIQQFEKVDYPKNRIYVVIYSNFNRAGARIPKLLTRLRYSSINNCHAVFKIEDNILENETTIFKKMDLSTFLCRISSNSKIDLQKSLNNINQKTNSELARMLVFKNNDAVFLNKTYVSTSYLNYNDYNKMQEAILKKTEGTEFIYNIT